jgi:hypothetical protein
MKARSKSALLSEAPTFSATSRKRLYRSASISFGGRVCSGFFVRFPKSDDWGFWCALVVSQVSRLPLTPSNACSARALSSRPTFARKL